MAELKLFEIEVVQIRKMKTRVFSWGTDGLDAEIRLERDVDDSGGEPPLGMGEWATSKTWRDDVADVEYYSQRVALPQSINPDLIPEKPDEPAKKEAE